MSDLTREYLESEEGKRFIEASPLQQIGKPENIRGAFLLLASDHEEDGGWVTGTVLTVDGGHALV